MTISKEYNREYWKQYHQKNKESSNERSKQWRKDNPEKRKKYNKQWRLENLGYGEKWRKDNREHCVKYGKQWKKDNPEYVRKTQKKYFRTDKGKATNQRGHYNRRARELKCINTLTAKEWLDILKQYKFRCAYCEKEFTLFDRETRDHIIPLSKGGDNIKENIVPACKSCNSKKYNKIKN